MSKRDLTATEIPKLYTAFVEHAMRHQSSSVRGLDVHSWPSYRTPQAGRQDHEEPGRLPSPRPQSSGPDRGNDLENPLLEDMDFGGLQLAVDYVDALDAYFVSIWSGIGILLRGCICPRATTPARHGG